MSLSQYNQKRNFRKTAEPKGKEKKGRGALRFVVQKHDASSLHYDLRLELDGVLKSWALPKGPSLNPADKRLAMMVEDHPLDYRQFEGVIPEGEYGGGTVMVWDEGHYYPGAAKESSRPAQEETLRKALKKGRLSFVLEGQKLRGEFLLVQMAGKGENTWLLRKKTDAQSRSEDVRLQNLSVKSGRTLAAIAAAKGASLHHPDADGLVAAKPAKQSPTKEARVFESEVPSAQRKAGSKTKAGTKSNGNAGQSARKTNANLPASDSATDETVTINGQRLQLTNLQKLYWPKEGFRKGDVVTYYRQVAAFIMPYLRDRPQSLNRHPNGIDGKNFFQKNVRGKVPDWIETFSEFSESTGETVAYLVCRNEASLVYMANLGCIEINPWHARKQHYQKPDWCLIDLDPDTGNSYAQVMEVALLMKTILAAAGAPCYVKTSGASGLHLYLPLAAKYDFAQSKALAETVATLANRERPQLTSTERSPAKRKGKIYLDFLQNKETQTAAAPYSLRPRPGMPVSTPLDWSELKKNLTPTTWNAKNILDRLKTEGDLFQPVLGKAIALPAVLKKLQALL